MRYPIVLFLAVIGAPATAQEPPAPACPATPVQLPPEFAGWASAAPVSAAASAADLGKARARLGSRADVTLLPAAQVQFVAPERPTAAGTFSGLISFSVPVARTYRIALGAPAWIDVVRDGKPVASGAHGHGVACTAVRKTVDFALTPGNYVLQVSGNHAATVSVMILPLP